MTAAECKPSAPCGHCDHCCADVIPVLRYRSTRLDTVRPERVSWIWPGRIPRGKLVLLDGDPSVGKSTVANDVVARITTGRPLPGDSAALLPPADVILMAAEDGLGDTIRPRLDAAGADPTRVHHFDTAVRMNDDGSVRFVPPSIPGDVGALEALVVDTGAVLVVVDVLMAYLSGSADSHRDQDVRGALAELGAMADRTGAAVLMLRHLRKSRGASAIYAGGGSIGIIGVARAALVAAADPDDDTGTRRVLAVSKSNLAAIPPALQYRLVTSPSGDVATVEWLGESRHSADDLMAASDPETRSALDDAAAWLASMLVDGPTPKRDILKAARAEGISDPTLKRAAKSIEVVSERDDNARGRPATWRLPDSYGSSVMAQNTMNRNPQPSDQGFSTDSAGYGSARKFEPKHLFVVPSGTNEDEP